jgi:Glyoxalase-like domain
MRIDHVLYAVADLDAAAARFAQDLQLEPIRGGEHGAWGTANCIVPLGPDYLELIGVADRATAAESQLGRLVLDTADGLLAWAVVADDLDRVAARLGLEITRASRARPDGVRLTWRMAGVEQAMASAGSLPFFIQWEGGDELHPGGDPSAPPGIHWVQVAADEARLREWLGDAELPLRFAAEGRGITAAAIGGITLV